MALFMFVARSFANEVTRSIASCCQGLATVRCDCSPRMFSCSLFTSSLIRVRTAAWEAQLGPLDDEKDCNSAASFLIFAMIGFAASSCAVTLGLSVAASACSPAGKAADASQRTPESTILEFILLSLLFSLYHEHELKLPAEAGSDAKIVSRRVNGRRPTVEVLVQMKIPIEILYQLDMHV